MIPKNNVNIYPKTEENLSALLHFYFGKLDLPMNNAVEILMNKSSLSLNQVEFIVRKLSESWNEVFKQSFKNGTSIPNLLRYGIEGLTKKESDWDFPPYSTGRSIIRDFLQFVNNSETDYEFLETNN